MNEVTLCPRCRVIVSKRKYPKHLSRERCKYQHGRDTLLDKVKKL